MTKTPQPTPEDHVSRLIAERRRETPDVPLEGMEVLSRARRLTLVSRPSIEAVFEKYGIDTGEFDVLASLQRSGAPYALRPTELYQVLMISSGGLSDRLSRLSAKGLVSREASQADGRSTLVQLTQRGRALIDSAFREDMEVEAKMLSHLTDDEQKTLARLLAKLLRALENR